MRLNPRFALLLSAVALGLACGDGSGPGLTLDVSPDSVQLVRNSSVQLTVNALNSAGSLVTGIAVTFESDDTTIVTVTNLGLVSAGAITGATSIRVSGGGAVTMVPVRVTGIPSGIFITPADTLIRSNGTVQYRAVVRDEVGDTIKGIAVAWTSSDTSIATISSTGRATTKLKAGVTYIGASYGGSSGFVPLRVAIPGVATQVTITPSDTAIDRGASVQLTATLSDAFGDPVAGGSFTWLSGAPSIATVSSTGKVQASSSPGDASIQAQSGSLYGSALVTVLDSMVVGRTRLCCRPQGAAIFGNVAYVTQLDNSLVSRANLPSHKFNSSVTVGSIPTAVAFNSTGSRAYVANEYSNSLTVINVATNTAIDVIPANSRPFEAIVAPGDSIIYVSGISNVVGIRLSTKEVVASFPIPEAGNGISIARDSLLYASSHTGGTIVEFNLRTRTVSRTFAVGGDPLHTTVSPDGNELWIANGSGYVQFWNIDSGTQIGPNLALPAAGYGIMRRSSNGLLYVTSFYSGGGYLYVIDPVSRTLLHSTVLGGGTRDVVFTADGSIGLVANEGGWVDFLR